jgi:hypothetical protein
MSAFAWIWPLLAAYARHAGGKVSEPELRRQLERRLSFFPLWTRLYMAAAAAFVRYGAPLLLLKTARAFERLSESEKEECLVRLQRDGRLPVRPLFLGIKSLLLACCYGSPEFLRTIGYEAKRAVRA